MLTNLQKQILDYLGECNHNFVDKADRIKRVARRFSISQVDAAYELITIGKHRDKAQSEHWKDWQGADIT